MPETHICGGVFQRTDPVAHATSAELSNTAAKSPERSSVYSAHFFGLSFRHAFCDYYGDRNMLSIVGLKRKQAKEGLAPSPKKYKAAHSDELRGNQRMYFTRPTLDVEEPEK